MMKRANRLVSFNKYVKVPLRYPLLAGRMGITTFFVDKQGLQNTPTQAELETSLVKYETGEIYTGWVKT